MIQNIDANFGSRFWILTSKFFSLGGSRCGCQSWQKPLLAIGFAWRCSGGESIRKIPRVWVFSTDGLHMVLELHTTGQWKTEFSLTRHSHNQWVVTFAASPHTAGAKAAIAVDGPPIISVVCVPLVIKRGWFAMPASSSRSTTPRATERSLPKRRRRRRRRRQRSRSPVPLPVEAASASSNPPSGAPSTRLQRLVAEAVRKSSRRSPEPCRVLRLDAPAEPALQELLADKPEAFVKFLSDLGVQACQDVRTVWRNGQLLVEEFETDHGRLPADQAFSIAMMHTLACRRGQDALRRGVGELVDERTSTERGRPVITLSGVPEPAHPPRQVIREGFTGGPPVLVELAARDPDAREVATKQAKLDAMFQLMMEDFVDPEEIGLSPEELTDPLKFQQFKDSLLVAPSRLGVQRLSTLVSSLRRWKRWALELPCSVRSPTPFNVAMILRQVSRGGPTAAASMWHVMAWYATKMGLQFPTTHFLVHPFRMHELTHSGVQACELAPWELVNLVMMASHAQGSYRLVLAFMIQSAVSCIRYSWVAESFPTYPVAWPWRTVCHRRRGCMEAAVGALLPETSTCAGYRGSRCPPFGRISQWFALPQFSESGPGETARFPGDYDCPFAMAGFGAGSVDGLGISDCWWFCWVWSFPLHPGWRYTCVVRMAGPFCCAGSRPSPSERTTSLFQRNLWSHLRGDWKVLLRSVPFKTWSRWLVWCGPVATLRAIHGDSVGREATLHRQCPQIWPQPPYHYVWDHLHHRSRLYRLYDINAVRGCWRGPRLAPSSAWNRWPSRCLSRPPCSSWSPEVFDHLPIPSPTWLAIFPPVWFSIRTGVRSGLV